MINNTFGFGVSFGRGYRCPFDSSYESSSAFASGSMAKDSLEFGVSVSQEYRCPLNINFERTDGFSYENRQRQVFSDCFTETVCDTVKEKKEDNKTSFVCMYKDESRISAAADSYETIRKNNGTYEVISENATKLIYNEEKQLLIVFCGVMETVVHGKHIRLEDRLNQTLQSYRQGMEMSQFLALLRSELEYLENCIGTTNIFIGYSGFAGTPQIATYYCNVSETGECTVQTRQRIKGNSVAAGRYSGIVQLLEESPQEDTLHAVEALVRHAIALESFHPEGYRTVGGRVQSGSLELNRKTY